MRKAPKQPSKNCNNKLLMNHLIVMNHTFWLSLWPSCCWAVTMSCSAVRLIVLNPHRQGFSEPMGSYWRPLRRAASLQSRSLLSSAERIWSETSQSDIYWEQRMFIFSQLLCVCANSCCVHSRSVFGRSDTSSVFLQQHGGLTVSTTRLLAERENETNRQTGCMFALENRLF